jgi:hypothetical protein
MLHPKTEWLVSPEKSYPCPFCQGTGRIHTHVYRVLMEYYKFYVNYLKRKMTELYHSLGIEW